MKTILERFCAQFYWNCKDTKIEAIEVCKILKIIFPFPRELHLKNLKTVYSQFQRLFTVKSSEAAFSVLVKILYDCSFWFNSFKTVLKLQKGI